MIFYFYHLEAIEDYLVIQDGSLTLVRTDLGTLEVFSFTENRFFESPKYQIPKEYNHFYGLQIDYNHNVWIAVDETLIVLNE